MRKKILVTITVLAVIAALAAAFTGGQFFLVTTSRSDLLTFGNIDVTAFSPDPLISMTNLVPGEIRAATVFLRPKGTINQDVYIGLKDETWQTPATFGLVVKVRLSINDGATWSGWVPVHDYFTAWQLVASNVAPDALITVNVQVYVPMDLGPEFMNVSYSFKTLIDAVQVGGAPPATIPYLYP